MGTICPYPSKMNELNGHIKALEDILNTTKIEREVLASMLAVTENRIFSQGLDANGAGIGDYSSSYLKVRAKKGLGSSRKVVLQLTQQMRNDFSVIIGPDGTGLGFKNKVNFDKSFFVEDTYGKPIFEHTGTEVQLATRLYGEVSKRHINRNQ